MGEETASSEELICHINWHIIAIEESKDFL